MFNLDLNAVASSTVSAITIFHSPFALLIGATIAFICFTIIFLAIKK